METILFDIYNLEKKIHYGYSFKGYEPILPEFIYHVGLTRVASDTYPDLPFEEACMKLFDDVSLAQVKFADRISAPPVSDDRLIIGKPCNGCGGGTVL